MTGADDFYRSVKAATSRTTGERFEAWLAALFDRLEDYELAAIQKAPEPYKQIGATDSSGRFRAVRTKKAPVDFSGVLTGGQAVYIEAKATAGDEIKRSRLRPEQREYLTSRERLGAVVLTALGFQQPTGHFDVFILPWRAWDQGPATRTRANCDHFKLPDILTFKTAADNVRRWRCVPGDYPAPEKEAENNE